METLAWLIEMVVDPFLWVLAFLAVVAWNRGWRGWGLLPVAAYYPIVPILVLLAYASGVYVDEHIAQTIDTLVFAAACIALIAMIIAGRNKKNKELLPTSNTGGSVRFCPNCGNEQQGNPLFCRNCGQRFGL